MVSLQTAISLELMLRPACFENVDLKPKTATHRVGGGENKLKTLNFIFQFYNESVMKLFIFLEGFDVLEIG